MMHSLLEQLERGRVSLEENPLTHVLGDAEVAAHAKLACIPDLTFFVLVFKDAMAMLSDPDATDPVSAMVRTHSMEDADHWRWFLRDLDVLNVDDIQHQPATHVLGRVWSTDLMAVRTMAYAVVHYIQVHANPVLRLVMLEVLEDGYASFTRHMSPVIRELGLYEKLEYFGDTHNAAEAGHELHHVPPEMGLERLVEGLTSEELEEAARMVTDLHEKLNRMHARFADTILAAAEC